jgi:PPOX class probable F420-dependent enzyme
MGRSESVAELPSWARSLLADARVARMGLLDDRGRPRVLPVTFAECGARLVTAVDHKPKRRCGEDLARVRWLRARPSAALTVDRYDEDWKALAWIQALGDVDVLDVTAAPDAVAALAARYEPYRTQPPAGPVLALSPERLLWWRASE